MTTNPFNGIIIKNLVVTIYIGGIFMGFFDKVKATASNIANKAVETGNDLGEKSKVAIEKQKIKSAISKENSAINKKYTEIGKKYVELFADNHSPEFEEFIADIKKSQEQITKLSVQLESLEDYVLCSCGTKVPKNAMYCPNCGNQVVVAPTTAVESSSEHETAVQEVAPETNTEEEATAEEPSTEEATTESTTTIDDDTYI